MQESDALSRPLWLRIGLPFLMFLNAALGMWSHFSRFEWVPWFCIGLYFLVGLQRQSGEALRAYFQKTRSIASVVLLIIAVAGFGYNFYRWSLS
jgi:hypothetical protein